MPNHLPPRVIKVPRPPNLLNSSSFSCSSPLQKPSKTEEQVSSFSDLIQRPSFLQSGDNRGNIVVERSIGSLEWQDSVPSPSRLGDRNRCLSPKLGSLLRRDWNRRSLGSTQTEPIAGYFALKSFTRDGACVHVHLLMDNVSAVSYINKVGGTHSHMFST